MTEFASETRQPRWLAQRLPSPDERRLVVITGARQTGKTTLAQRIYGDSLRYLNLDDLDLREGLEDTRATEWARSVGPAILDEAQKVPSVFDKVKYAYDDESIDFSVLLGSSRILLLEKVRESLAGRAFLYDLWPLLLSEIATPEKNELETPLVGRVLDGAGETSVTEALGSQPARLFGDEAERRRAAFDHLERWGGMPELLRLDDETRRLWFDSYQQTYLERDLVDLARLSDLRPFQKLQRLAMLRSGQILHYANLARDAQISASTARRYLEYLRLTYQVVLLQPFHENLTSQVVKTPKLYWSDLGLLRAGTKQWGQLDGELFETLVVAEMQKWISTSFAEADLFYYRTRGGLEVDLLVELSRGIVGIEIKNRETTTSRDLRALRSVAEALGERWKGGLVIYRGDALRPIDEELDVWEMPVDRFFA